MSARKRGYYSLESASKRQLVNMQKYLVKSYLAFIVEMSPANSSFFCLKFNIRQVLKEYRMFKLLTVQVRSVKQNNALEPLTVMEILLGLKL